MKWLTHIVVIVAALVGVLALIPFFFSVDDYIPLVEKELSARLEMPVSIDDLDISLFPIPHVRAEGIALGKTEDITVSKIRLTPDVWSLLDSSKVIRSVELEEVTLSQRAIAVLMDVAQRGRGGPGTLRIEAIKLKTALLKLDNASFGPFDAEVQVGSAGQRGEIKLSTQDGALDVRLTPVQDRYALELTAKSWTPPIGPALRFDSLEVKGSVTNTAAELGHVEARLYGGSANGNVNARWQEGISLKGQLDLKQIELKDVVALLSPTTRVSGRLDASPVFSADAPAAEKLDEALRLDSNFTVRDGILHGIDLPAAAAALTRQRQSGGQTRFDQLSGHLSAARKSYRFTQLRIASGPLSASGNVTIAPNKALSGELSASASAAGRVAAVPLVVAGTVDSPMVYPNPKALIGAAAGTAILGPGLGTAAGSKLGEIAGGLLEGARKR